MACVFVRISFVCLSLDACTCAFLPHASIVNWPLECFSYKNEPVDNFCFFFILYFHFIKNMTKRNSMNTLRKEQKTTWRERKMKQKPAPLPPPPASAAATTAQKIYLSISVHAQNIPLYSLNKYVCKQKLTLVEFISLFFFFFNVSSNRIHVWKVCS